MTGNKRLEELYERRNQLQEEIPLEIRMNRGSLLYQNLISEEEWKKIRELDSIEIEIRSILFPRPRNETQTIIQAVSQLHDTDSLDKCLNKET